MNEVLYKILFTALALAILGLVAGMAFSITFTEWCSVL